MMKKPFISIFLSLSALAVCADTVDDASELAKEGNWEKALSILKEYTASNPKGATPRVNHLLGICEFETGNYSSAAKHLKAAKEKGFGESSLYLGRLAFLDYDFEGAEELYSEYRKFREKGKKPESEDLQEAERLLQNASNAMERVEKITVLDSIAVPADGFFKFYKLPSSAGRLLSPAEMPLEEYRQDAVVAFINEGNDFMMWGEPDSIGNVSIVESTRLMDGKWQKPVFTPDWLRKGGYADYPFMMPDGVTLYYASDGDESMGGYDIFVVSRDSQTGEYLQPQNLGMPFNSPYDDFMLAIDEENGIGWWATDRNLLGDQLTIYVFKVNELRKNYDPDDEDLASKARISDWRATQSDADSIEISSLLAAIDAIDETEAPKAADFMIPKKGGGFFKSLEDFRNPQARAAVRKYLASLTELDKEEKHLASLRKRYASGRADNVRVQILQFEKEIESHRKEVKHLRSEIYRLEK